jgi:DNA-binding transcriptional regulator YhcF (GntR family)
MEFIPDSGSKTPVYLQIANFIERQILSGVWQTGARLPSERMFCAQMGVARGTVKSAHLELAARGYVKILPGSGIYVTGRKEDALLADARSLLSTLKQQGLGKWEVEQMAREVAWAALTHNELVHVAWVDCSPELLEPVTRQIKDRCHVRVSSFLLNDIMEDPYALAGKNYDLIATTINHFDELKALAELPEYANASFERLVLSLGRTVVSTIAAIRPGDHIAVFYDSAMYRRSVEMFLAEFGAQAHYTYYPLRYGIEEFSHHIADCDLVIVPPDTSYMDGMVQKILETGRKNGVKTLLFENIIDYGSLLWMKERAQGCWLKKAGTNPDTGNDGV